MPRFYIKAPLEVSLTISLPLPIEVVRHLHVLRIIQGQTIELFNGDGFSYECELLELTKKSAQVNIVKRLNKPLSVSLSIKLAVCIIANDKMDLVIQKATELGLQEITPVISARTQRIDKARMEKKLLHWQNIIISSCEQCGNNILPVLSPICEINDIFKQSNENALKIILSPVQNAEKIIMSTQVPAEILLLVGPEGGFTPEELNIATNSNFKSLTLGHLTMRAETAAIAGIVSLRTKFDNWMSW